MVCLKQTLIDDIGENVGNHTNSSPLLYSKHFAFWSPPQPKSSIIMCNYIYVLYLFMYWETHIEVRGQCVGIGFLLVPCGSPGSDLTDLAARAFNH